MLRSTFFSDFVSAALIVIYVCACVYINHLILSRDLVGCVAACRGGKEVMAGTQMADSPKNPRTVAGQAGCPTAVPAVNLYYTLTFFKLWTRGCRNDCSRSKYIGLTCCAMCRGRLGAMQ